MNKEDIHLMKELGMMDDQAKAQIIATRIKEQEETTRAKIREEAETKCSLPRNEGYYSVRGLVVLAFIVAIVTTGLTVYYSHLNWINLQMEKTHAEHPEMIKCPKKEVKE